jgi:L-fuculose-phosphate aldolase
MTERQARLILTEFGRRMRVENYIVATDGNLSIRIGDKIIISPSGLAKDRLNPDDFVVINQEGQKIRGSRSPSTEWPVHTAAYQARPETCCVLHAHPLYATAFASAGLALEPPFLTEIRDTIGRVPLVPFAEPGSRLLAENLRPFLSESPVCLLENHGLVATGATVDEAWFNLERAEHFAHILYLKKNLLTGE